MKEISNLANGYFRECPVGVRTHTRRMNTFRSCFLNIAVGIDGYARYSVRCVMAHHEEYLVKDT